MRESLVDRRLIASTEAPARAILPHVSVVKIGGRSIMDRGRSKLLPLLDKAVESQLRHTLRGGLSARLRRPMG
jgi:molybdenum storage protein